MISMWYVVCDCDIQVNMPYATRTVLSIQFVHGDLCKHLGIDSRYSNLFLIAYINRHVHSEYLKMI